MWRPLRDEHAIEVMAVQVRLADALPGQMFRKVLAEAEERAFANGLRSRNEISQIQLSVNAAGVLQPPRPERGDGYIFNSVARSEDGEDGSAATIEQFTVDPNQLMYRTFAYVSWNAVKRQVDQLITPPLSLIQEWVGIKALRLEYLDVFWNDDPEAPVSELLAPSSPYLPNYVYGLNDLWHSHTGSFVDTPLEGKLLRQVKFDLVNAPHPHHQEYKVKTLRLMTAEELRPRSDDESTKLVKSPYVALDEMHASLKIFLGTLISSDMVKQIGASTDGGKS